MLAEPTRSVALGSQQDTGKTVCLCEVIVRAKFKRVLIVGVKDAYKQWHDRLAAQSDGALEMLRVDATKAGLANFQRLVDGEDGIFFGGHQFLSSKDWALVQTDTDGTKKRRHLKVYSKMRPLDALISDESQIHANRKSNGIGTIRSIPTDWKFALSGTPAGNRIENLHTIGRWLWPNELDPFGEHIVNPSIHQWRARWCRMETKYVAGGKAVSAVIDEKEPGAIVAAWPCWIRMMSPSGPVPIPDKVMVELSPAERAIYSQIEEEGVAWLRQHGDLEPLVANLPITRRTRLRTAALGVMSFDADGEVFFDADAESSKMNALHWVLNRPDWKGRPAVIFTHSKTFARMASARMVGAGYSAALWTGDVPSKQRDVLLRDFMGGSIQYLVAVIESLSRSYDGLQTACNRVVWASRSDNNEMNDQAGRRVWRSGGDLDDYQSVELIAHETYDEGVFHADIDKSARMGAVLAGTF